MGNTSAESSPNDLLTCVLRWLLEFFKANTHGALLMGDDEAVAVNEYVAAAAPTEEDNKKLELQRLIARRRELRSMKTDVECELNDINKRLDKLLSELNLKGS